MIIFKYLSMTRFEPWISGFKRRPLCQLCHKNVAFQKPGSFGQWLTQPLTTPEIRGSNQVNGNFIYDQQYLKSLLSGRK